MKANLVQNYVFYILFQVVQVLTPIILVPYTTRVLGATALSVNAFTGSVLQWFIIFGVLGVTMYGNKEIARVSDNREKLSKTFLEIFVLKVINMALMGVVYLLFVYFANIEYKNIYYLQFFVLLASLFDITWFYLGIENFKTASIRNIALKIINVLLIFLLVKSENDLPLFVIINGGTAFIGQIVLFFQLPKYIDRYPISLKSAYKNHMKANLILFVPQIAISVYSILDQTMTGILAPNIEELAYYQQAIRFDKMFLYFITSIGMVMLPRIANEHAKGGHQKIKEYLSITLNIALYFSIPMMFGLIGISQTFVDWFLAAEFKPVGLLIAIISPIVILISLSNAFGVQFLVPTNRLKPYSFSVSMGAVTNFILNFLLIPTYGAIGSAISVVCAEAVVTIIQFIVIRKHLTFNLKFLSIIEYFIAGIAMLTVVLFIGNVRGANVITNLFQALAGSIVYFGILFIVKEPFHYEMFAKLKGLVWKKSV